MLVKGNISHDYEWILHLIVKTNIAHKIMLFFQSVQSLNSLVLRLELEHAVYRHQFDILIKVSYFSAKNSAHFR